MPPPSLSWWRDTELIDDTYEEVNGQTINTLEMKNVTREDQETVMECRLPSDKPNILLTEKVFSIFYSFISCQ